MCRRGPLTGEPHSSPGAWIRRVFMSSSIRPALLALLLSASLAGAQAGPAPKTGDFKDDCKDKSGGIIMHYRLCAPTRLPEEKVLGLIVWFHGMGGNEDGAGTAIEATKRAKLS